MSRSFPTSRQASRSVRPGWPSNIARAVALRRILARWSNICAVSLKLIAVGTSRGSLSVANAVAKLKGEGNQRPDAAVLTSAFLKVGAQVPDLTVFKIANGDARALDVPTMLVWHVADTCPHTSAATVPPFRAWYQTSGRKLAEKSFSGGLPPKSEPCEAFAPHGFYGLDPEVAGAITAFVGAL